jgi:hypothetical protein
MAKPHSKNAIKRAERDAKIIQLLRAGVEYDVICEQVGCSKSTISKTKMKQLAQYKFETQQDVAVLQQLELSRLDHLQRVFWPKAIAGNNGAFDRIIVIQRQRAAITGMNAPTKIAPTDPTGQQEYQGGGLSSLLAAHRESKKGGGT